MTPPAAAGAAAPAIHPRRSIPSRRPAVAPRRPRRVSGPARPARSVRNPARAVGLAETVATHRLLDRLIRGRLWIGVVAFALIGIVTMQLGLLKLNAGIGRSLEREALLQRENATLSTENSEMAAGERVEAQAGHAGMELIPSGALRFLAARPSFDASKGAAALSAAVSTTSGNATTTSGTSGTAESSSGTETRTATSGATAETESATTSAATSPGASTGEAHGAPAAASTPSETHPTEATSPGSSSSGGAGEATAGSAASTGGGTTPQG